MSSLLFRFRQQYPQGSLRCDLLKINQGLYLVQASVTVEGTILATALAAEATVEAAEDRARERALAILNLSSTIETPKLETLQTTTVSSPQPISPPPTLPTVAIPPSQASTPITPLTAKPTPPVIPPKQETIAPTPLPVPPVKPISREAELPVVPAPEPELPFTLQSEVYPPPERPEADGQPVQNGTQTPLPMDVNSLTTENVVSFPLPEATATAPSLFEQSTTAILNNDDFGGDRPEDEEEPIDFSEIIARSNLELKRLGWTSDQGRNYLLQTYGKRSRQLLSDEQLIEFLAYLEQQPTPE